MSPFTRRLQQSARVDVPGGGGFLNAPQYVTATVGDSKVTFWWSAVATATDYAVQYRTSPAGTWQTWPHGSTLTHEVVTGLINDTAYDFRVRAVRGLDYSEWSDEVVGITPIAANNSGGGLPSEIETILKNTSSTDTVYAYVIGLDSNNGRWTLVTSDGQGTYQPPTPEEDNTPLGVDCAIPLNAQGAPGVSILIPRLVSGRIFISYDTKMQFFMNSNGGFVMPSEKNTDDPNINIQWTFAEFTFNNVELYGNISFVDMLSVPVAFELETSDGSGIQYVPGLPSGAMSRVANKLVTQAGIDGGDWDKCLYYSAFDSLVRILSPNSVVQVYPTAFEHYLDPYIDQVWQKYTTEDLIVNTNKVEWGDKVGRVVGGVLDFGGGMIFAKPSTQSIWSCSIPPWTTGNDEQGNVTARLTAAFNRSTLLVNTTQPNGEDPRTYYANSLTNHYSRIVHEEVFGNLGYAFPYDDVHPEGGISYEGRVQSSSPLKWTITVGRV